jgi:hypothetical protein
MAAVPVGCRYIPFSPPKTFPQPEDLGKRRPAEVPAAYPFADDGVTASPVCLRSHWDPEQIIRRTLPAGSALATPLDPRPWTKICTEYVTSQDFEVAPRPSDDQVFPSGGVVYPPSRYREAIDHESSLLGRSTPLSQGSSTCSKSQYIPSPDSTLYRSGSTLPDRLTPSDRFISELAMPAALLRPAGSAGYPCRVEQDQIACKLSPALFNNTTKQNRYWAPGHRPNLQQPPAIDPMPTSKVRLS